MKQSSDQKKNQSPDGLDPQPYEPAPVTPMTMSTSLPVANQFSVNEGGHESSTTEVVASKFTGWLFVPR